MSGIEVSGAFLGAYIIGRSVLYLAFESNREEEDGFWHRLGRWRRTRQEKAEADMALPPPMDDTERLMRSIPDQDLDTRCQTMARLGEIGTPDALPMLDDFAGARFGHQKSRDVARTAALTIRLRSSDEDDLLNFLRAHPELSPHERSAIVDRLGDIGALASLKVLADGALPEDEVAVGKIRSRMDVLEQKRGSLTLPEDRQRGALTIPEDAS